MTPDVFMQITREIQRARSIHKPLPVGDVVRSAALLAEEAGEVVKAALDLTRMQPDDRAGRMLKLYQLRSEVVHAAAVAAMWLDQWEIVERENIPKEETKVGK